MGQHLKTQQLRLHSTTTKRRQPANAHLGRPGRRLPLHVLREFGGRIPAGIDKQAAVRGGCAHGAAAEAHGRPTGSRFVQLISADVTQLLGVQQLSVRGRGPLRRPDGEALQSDAAQAERTSESCSVTR